jgi:glycosyltransferase involved in cell wall biosynthesis
MKAFLFSICIPVRNDPANLKECLAGFQKQDLSDCEILVCDDGSSPSLSADDFQNTLEFRLIRQAGRGPSAARNHLARVATGTYLFFVDADTVPQPHLIEVARNLTTEDPQMAACYGAYDDEPAHRTLVSSYKNLLHHYTHLHSASGKERVTTFWCGCGIIRRELYLESGGLSEFYDKPSIEDIELGSRLSARGVHIRIVPQLQVKHLKKWTMRNWLYTDVFRRGIPWVRLMRAKNDWASQLNFSWSQRMASFAALTFIACIPLAAASPAFALAGLMALAVFLVPNLPFFDLVRRKRGLMVSLAAIPLHMTYALVCVASVGVAFLYPPLKLPPTMKLCPLRDPRKA